MASFDITPYSSTNPAVGQLFAAEFAQRAAQRQADAQAAQNEIARQQIRAQSQLAQAQQRQAGSQQEYNNLFREREFQSREKGDAERNALMKRQLDIDEKWKVPKTDIQDKQRTQAIIDANSNAVNDAARANALLQINTDSAVAAAKKALPMGAGLFGGVTAANLDDPNHPARRAIQKQAFDAVRSQLLAEKGGALNSLIPDAQSFTFKPVQFDETGKAIALPLPTPGSGASNPAALGTPKTGYDNSGNADAPGGTIGNPAALGPMAPETQAISSVVQPVVNKVLGSTADMFGIKAPASAPTVAPQTIQVPIDEAHFMELSAVDAAEAERQLRAIPLEQRPAAAAAIRDNLMKSGRATIRVRIPPLHEVLRDTPFN